MAEKITANTLQNNQGMRHENVQYIEIDENNEQQRIDNFLIATLKGVPRSRVYRILRKGEVRVNKKRCKATQRLVVGDLVRIPPIRVSTQKVIDYIPNFLKRSLEQDILFEDDVLLVINKPSGFAVHGGSGINSGIIEGLRSIRPDAGSLELVHRLDRDTSGCLIIAKKRSALRKLHDLFRSDGIDKTYQALLVGRWQRKKCWVEQPLLKNVSKSGERMVVVSKQGKPSETLFRRIQTFDKSTWVEATPKTGRTHQIRVHAAWLGHAIVGDDRYGQSGDNREFKKAGFKRLVLHARQLVFEHPVSGEKITIQAPLPNDLDELIKHLYFQPKNIS